MGGGVGGVWQIVNAIFWWHEASLFITNRKGG